MIDSVAGSLAAAQIVSAMRGELSKHGDITVSEASAGYFRAILRRALRVLIAVAIVMLTA